LPRGSRRGTSFPAPFKDRKARWTPQNPFGMAELFPPLGPEPDAVEKRDPKTCTEAEF